MSLAKEVGVCCGIIIVIIAIFMILDIGFDPVIHNNTTVTIDKYTLTVPQTDNFTINDSYSYFYEKDFEKYGMDNYTNATANNSINYYDYNHNVSIDILDKNKTSYTDQPDGEEIVPIEMSGRYIHQKKDMGDKLVVVTTHEDRGLARNIINSVKTKS
ncbi:MAG: hypothetical protein IJH55_07050 [Romboutsia sp.]|nr:hypothetical protein [Methanosphaera sp.]MBQ6631850.1 hypothetical protein [Romboutsia sp.]